MDQSDIDLLQIVPSYHLQAVVKMRHVPLSPLALNSGASPASSSPSPSSPAVALEIARYLFDALAILEVLQDLATLEKLIMRELVINGGRANSRDLALYFTNAELLDLDKKTEPAHDILSEYRVTTPLQPPQYPTAHPHGVFEQALRHLLVLGLLFWGKQTNFAGRDYTSGIHDGVLIVPVAVRDVVHQALIVQEPQTEDPLDQSQIGEGVRELQRNLYLYWSLVASQHEGLSLVTNGLLSRSALRLLTEQPGLYNKSSEHEQARSESDAPFLLFLRLLMMKLGLLQEKQNAIYAAPAEPFFTLPLLERARRCYQLYQETPFWNEILYLPEVNVRPGPSPFDPVHEEIMHARQLVLERVRHEHQGELHNLTAFIARLKLYAPYLLFPRQYGSRAERYSSNSNPYNWDFRLRRGWLTHREGWHMVEGGFIRAIITGPLYWFGIVELDHKEHPTAFRLAPGITLITSSAVPTSEAIPWGRLIVQPNFELVALAPVSEALLMKLDRFAERISLEHIAQYRITKASIIRAIQRGLHAELIQGILEQAVGGEIPQNVRYSLIEWERQARRVEIWQNTTLLEVDDPTLLDSLFEDAQTRALLGRRLSPTLTEIAYHQLHTVQQLLWARHYLPALTSVTEHETTHEDASQIYEPQWRLHDDGQLQPFYAVLDLYLVAEVERFSEHGQAPGWYRLTAPSIQQALEHGITLEHILHFLQQYCEGGIPPSLLIRLKIWGGGYADQKAIHVEHAPLLHLSTAILQDIQADEELELLLGREVQQEGRLVHIDADKLPQLLALLRERGFTLD